MRYSTCSSLLVLVGAAMLAGCGEEEKVTKIGEKVDVDSGLTKPSDPEPEKTQSPTTTDVPAVSASAKPSAKPADTTDAPPAGDAGEPPVVVADAGEVPVEPPPEETTTECPSIDDLKKDATKIEIAPATIGEDTLWTCEKLYVLSDNTTTIVRNNSTLSIGPGTHIFGKTGSALVVTKGSRLVAEGEKGAPIVFTSAKNEGQRAAKDWGGLLLLGDAPINEAGGTAKGEGIDPTQPYASYGGTDAESDCGSLKYVRVEFAGFEYAKDKELNNIGLAGCGSKTKLDYVQVHKGGDDGIEFWGGSPQLSHIVSSANQDDSFDWTSGFSGKVQFLAIIQSLDGGNPDSGFEADNSESDWAATPSTQPEIYNVTMIGAGDFNGMVLRRGTYGKVYNAIITNFAKTTIDVRTGLCAQAANDGLLTVEHSMFFSNGANHFRNETEVDSHPDKDGTTENPANEASDLGFDESAFFKDAARSNQFDVDPGLGTPDPTAPNWVPPADSPAKTGAITPPSGFDRSAKYIGAFAPGGEDWTAGWTNYAEK